MPDVTLKDVADAHAAGRIAEARALCNRVLEATPGDGDAFMWSALIAIAELRLPEAIAAFERALEIRIEPWSLASLGTCYAKIGEIEAAERCLRGSIELKPDHYAGHIGLAAALHGRRRFDEALSQLEVAAGINARDHEVDIRRGCTLAELRRYEEAQDAFARAIASTPAFIYPRLVKFDRVTYDVIAAGIAVPPPRVEVDAEPGPAAAQRVIVISCNPPYARKYAAPFLRSYAARACTGDLLHLHIPDPDLTIVDEMVEVADHAGLDRITITSETSPFPDHEVQQRRAYYACARLLHLPYWLELYQVPILLLDVDFIVERPLDVLFEAGRGHDVCLNARHPIDSPWLDVIANVIVANPTPAARRYFGAVAHYALAHVTSEPQAWLVDQAALYCVLRMFARFGTAPAVRWLPEAHKSGLWHIGHLYDHHLNDPRFQRYA